MVYIPAYILVIFFIIVIDYFVGIKIGCSVGRKRKFFLVVSIITNVGVLAVFKYYNFFVTNLNFLSELIHWNYSLNALKYLLPLGLSFHTFQALSYTIEVYRGNYQPEKNFLTYALYVMFFPQMVAGPIERPQNILPQFYVEHKFNAAQALSGMKLMAWGFFKKLVIADRSAVIVNQIFSTPSFFGGAGIMVATVLFAFQIYGDFSGYSDIARGASRVMGIKLMKNFDLPYFSRSVKEFWRRWHISLSSWFRDYVYISLGGNRVKKILQYRNILIIFLISGLWHGAAWNFVVWGGLHGLYIIFEELATIFLKRFSFHFSGYLARFVSGLQYLATFLMVSFAWIFFRSSNLKHASSVISELGGNYRWGFYKDLNVTLLSFATTIMLIFILFLIEYFSRRANSRFFFKRHGLVLRWSAYAALIWAILVFGELGGQQFIYFVF